MPRSDRRPGAALSHAASGLCFVAGIVALFEQWAWMAGLLGTAVLCAQTAWSKAARHALELERPVSDDLHLEMMRRTTHRAQEKAHAS